jgi:hypothetical protein
MGLCLSSYDSNLLTKDTEDCYQATEKRLFSK